MSDSFRAVPGESGLVARALGKRYKKRPVVRGVSLSTRTHTSLLIAPVRLEISPESARTDTRPRPPGMTA